MILLFTLALFLSTRTGADAEGPTPTHTVVGGDTVWSVATAHYPSEDPRPRVSDIERINRLDGEKIQPGMVLDLPAE